jgi:hypothetical protein
MADSNHRSFSGTFSRWAKTDRSDLTSTPITGEADLSKFDDEQATWMGYKGSTKDGRLIFSHDWGQPGEAIELTTKNLNGFSEMFVGPCAAVSTPTKIMSDNLPFSINVDLGAGVDGPYGNISLSFAAAPMSRKP